MEEDGLKAKSTKRTKKGNAQFSKSSSMPKVYDNIVYDYIIKDNTHNKMRVEGFKSYKDSVLGKCFEHD